MSEPKERKAEERAAKERETEKARSRKEAEEAKQERERREKQAQEERRRLRERERPKVLPRHGVTAAWPSQVLPEQKREGVMAWPSKVLPAGLIYMLPPPALLLQLIGSQKPSTQLLLKHSIFIVHSMQSPTSLHTLPPFCRHGVPAMMGMCWVSPSTQTSLVHSFMSSFGSALSSLVISWPLPSQTLIRQSSSVCEDVGVFSATFAMPHVPFMHVAMMHSFAG